MTYLAKSYNASVVSYLDLKARGHFGTFFNHPVYVDHI